MSFYKYIRKAAKHLQAHPLLTLCLLTTAVLFVVAGGLLFARPWSDDAFMYYKPEAIAGGNPFNLVEHSIDEIPTYLKKGNFRPVSRLGFYLENWTNLRASHFIGVGPNVTKSFIKILSTLAVVALLFMLARQTLIRPDPKNKRNLSITKWLVIFLPISLGSLLVLSSTSQHPLALFPNLYLVASAFAFGVLYLTGGAWFRDGEKWSRLRLLVTCLAFLLTGAAAASMIELAYIGVLAAPLYLIGLSVHSNGGNITRAFTKLWRSRSALLYGFMLVGFLLVFIPTRLTIARECNAGSCYRASQVDIEELNLGLISQRAFSPLLTEIDKTAPPFVADWPLEKIIIATLALVAIIYFLPRKGEKSREIDLTKNQLAVLVIVFVAVLIAAATLAGLSDKKQTVDGAAWVTPWRDTALLWPAWSLLIALFWSTIMVNTKNKALKMLIMGATLGALLLTMVYNIRVLNGISQTNDSIIHLEIGKEFNSFEKSQDGNDTRCSLFQAYQDTGINNRVYGVVTDSINEASLSLNGQGFCADS